MKRSIIAFLISSLFVCARNKTIIFDDSIPGYQLERIYRKCIPELFEIERKANCPNGDYPNIDDDYEFAFQYPASYPDNIFEQIYLSFVKNSPDTLIYDIQSDTIYTVNIYNPEQLIFDYAKGYMWSKTDTMRYSDHKLTHTSPPWRQAFLNDLKIWNKDSISGKYDYSAGRMYGNSSFSINRFIIENGQIVSIQYISIRQPIEYFDAEKSLRNVRDR